MTKTEEKHYRDFITHALALRHLLNCVPHDSDLTPEDREECLAWRPLSDACMRFAYTLRRAIWREWDRQRKEERQRQRAAQKRRQEKRKQREGERKRERKQAR